MANNLQSSDGGVSAIVSIFTTSNELERWAKAHGEENHPVVLRRLFELRSVEARGINNDRLDSFSLVGDNFETFYTDTHFETPNLVPWTPGVSSQMSPAVGSPGVRSLHTPIPIIHGSPFTPRSSTQAISPFAFQNITLCDTSAQCVSMCSTPRSSLNTPAHSWYNSPVTNNDTRSKYTPDPIRSQRNITDPLWGTCECPDLLSCSTPSPATGGECVTPLSEEASLHTPAYSWYDDSITHPIPPSTHSLSNFKNSNPYSQEKSANETESHCTDDDDEYFDSDWFYSEESETEQIVSSQCSPPPYVIKRCNDEVSKQ